MAYGVKYRLDFSDDRGFTKRVDILKNGYSSTILPWVGTDSPVTIEWASNENFYSPIIGSSCQLNMIVTDDISYDNFFEYDEREYKVNVYQDNGSGGYNLYWSGWITNDIYQQPIGSTPYTITITANDGIGTLDGYNTYTPAYNVDTCTIWEVIYNNLNYLGLAYNIYISNDIRDWNDASWSNVFEDVTIQKVGLFKDYYTIRDAKEVLISILQLFNCRLFQSNGAWYIVNNSSYGDQRVIEYMQTNPSASESTILGVKQGYLNAGTENIKYYYYNSSGTLLGNTTIDKLLVANTEIKQVNNNLYKLIKKPIKQVQQISDISQKFFDANDNASFEFQFDGWTNLTGTYGIVENPKSGKYALFTNEKVSTLTQVDKFNSSTFYMANLNSYEFVIDIFQETNSGTVGSNKIWWTVGITNMVDGLEYFYYDATNASANWGTNKQYNEIDITTVNDYFSFRKILQPTKTPSGGGLYGYAKLYITKPYSTASAYTGTYLDNVAVRYTTQLNKYKTIETIIYNSTDNRSGVLSTEGISLANVPSDIFAGHFGNYFKRSYDTEGKRIEEIAVRQRYNDNYNYVETFNSDFTLISGGSIKQIDMTNKIYLKLSTYTESDSAIIDYMKVDLKKCVYNCQFHIPNNYKDKTGIYYKNYKE